MHKHLVRGSVGLALALTAALLTPANVPSSDIDNFQSIAAALIGDMHSDVYVLDWDEFVKFLAGARSEEIDQVARFLKAGQWPEGEPMPDESRYTQLSRATPSGVGPVIKAGECSYRQANDNPHQSSRPAGDASVHGWWRYATGVCPTKANVDIYLDAYRCIYGLLCYWHNLAFGSRDVRQGGGSRNWANARHRCENLTTVSYRGRTDVDLIGMSDPPGYEYSYADVDCYPA